MPDPRDYMYLRYAQIISRTYGEGFVPTREAWDEMCRRGQGIIPAKQSDVEFDAEREREGDAQ